MISNSRRARTRYGFESNVNALRELGSLSELYPRTKKNNGGLTGREREELDYASRGFTSIEVATALYYGEQTSKFHRSNILAKLGARHIGHATLLGINANVLRTDLGLDPETVLDITPRQAQILNHFSHGLIHSETAAELGVGHQTVKFHASRLIHAIGARNMAHAVRISLEAPQPAVPDLGLVAATGIGQPVVVAPN